MSWDMCASMLRGFPAKEREFLELDYAVKEAFPGVDCQTFHSNGWDFKTRTLWWKAETDMELLSEYKARQVRKFVEGWKAGRQSVQP